MKLLRFALSLSALFLSLPSFAYFSTIDTAELLPEDQFRLVPELQFVTNPNSGVNFGARFDGSIDDETGYRAMLGFGETDFHIGGFLKWIPIPDVRNQPGMGFLAGLTYARNNDANELSIRIHPLISKKFHFEFGDLTPYGALPFGLTAREKKTEVPLQLALGTVFDHKNLEKLSFGGEIGFDVSKAYSYFSLFMNMAIDENGLEFK